MIRPLPPLLAAALAAAPAIAQAPPAPPASVDASRQDLQGLLSAADQDYQNRDQPGHLEDEQKKLEAAEKIAPNDYGVLWRIARHDFWVSDDPKLPDAQKSKLGKRAWDYGDRASAVNPAGVEGWHYAAVGMGNYSLGIGIFRALGEGVEGKFKDRLSRAEKIDPTFSNGAIPTAWGRFYYKLPWPKYDAAQSEKALLRAIKMNPDNVRAHVYLADLYAKEDHPKEARAQLQKAIAKPPGQYDRAEEERMQAVAREELGR
jgi:tetratricopeptide (TPR) repeat protein